LFAIPASIAFTPTTNPKFDMQTPQAVNIMRDKQLKIVQVTLKYFSQGLNGNLIDNSKDRERVLPWNSTNQP